MKILRNASVPVALVLASLPALARGGFGWGSPGEGHTRAVAGRFDGDYDVDLAVIVDGEISIAHAPGVYQARSTEVVAANDLAAFPAALLHEDLYVVNSSGLVRVGWDAGAQDWDIDVLESSHWVGAKALEVRDGANGPEIVGLMADGKELRRWSKVSETYQDQSFFTLANAARDLVCLEYDDDGSEDVAILTPSGVRIYDMTSSLLGAFEYAGFDTVDLARVRHAGETREWVAWIAGFQGVQYLGTAGSVEDDTVQGELGSISAVALGAGDWDHDGTTDLVVSHQLSHHLWILFDQSSGSSEPDYNPDVSGDYEIVALGVSGSAPTNQAQPVLADLEADGDDDLAFFVESTGDLFLSWGDAIDATSMAPLVSITQGNSVMEAHYYNDDDAPSGQRLELVVNTSSKPAAATHVKFVLFQKDDLQTPTDPDPIDTVTVTATGSDDDATLSLSSVVLDPGPISFDTLYFWRQRYVQLDGSGMVQMVWPVQVYGFEGQEDDPPDLSENAEYLLNLSEDENLWIVPLTNDNDSSSPPNGGDEDGTVTCLPNIPDFMNNVPPKPGS